MGEWAIDLALVRGDLFGWEVFAQLQDVIPAITAGGGLVFTCSDRDLFEGVYQEVGRQFPDLTYLRFANTNTLLLLKVSLLG